MTLIPDIIQSDIVTAAQDIFWHPLPDDMANLAAVKVLVVTQPYAAGSNEEVQIQKILQACQLATADYYILQLTNNIAWHQLKTKLLPKAVLLFGISPQHLGIAAMFRLYNPNHFDECIWVPCISLTEMEKHSDTKKQLWVDGLKPVFIDKTIGNI